MGAGRFARSFINALKKASPEMRYIVLTTSASGASDELTLLASGGWGLLANFFSIRSVFRRYDIIHALDGYPYGVIAALAALGLKKKLVITAIGSGALRPLGRPVAGRLLRWAYREADRLIAVSNYTKRELLKEMPDLSIDVINHGVDVNEFDAQHDVEVSGEEREKVQALRPYILSVGALKPRKGYQYSLEAFALIRPHFPNLHYVIVGNGDRREVDSIAVRLGISDRMVFFKNVSRDFLITLYRSAELFLLLPHDDHRDVEGFGLVFLEAAAAGIPVIGTHESGAGDAIAHELNGFLVPSRDSGRAAEAVQRILSDKNLQKKFSQGSLEFAKRMSWNRAAGRYREIYSSLE